MVHMQHVPAGGNNVKFGCSEIQIMSTQQAHSKTVYNTSNHTAERLKAHKNLCTLRLIMWHGGTELCIN